ncbi:hypothetical protein ABZ471_43245 [Streptomyces sp. NPDC005728]|uniref:hypothetical protein n=1 Tax=Streptomyces sp. NPDC005728 TaxID=3157054 RepID=UPI0033C34E11
MHEFSIRTATPHDLDGARSVMLDTVHRDFGSGYVPRWQAEPVARAWLPDLAENGRLGLYTAALSSVSGLIVLLGSAASGALLDAGLPPAVRGWSWPPFRPRRCWSCRDLRGDRTGRRHTMYDPVVGGSLTMSASPAVRSLRAAVFAAVCVLLAAAGHGLATGAVPPLWADAAALLVVFVPACALGGRERSLPGIGAAMLLTQAGLHLAFDAAGRTTGPGRTHLMSRTAAVPGHTMAAIPGHGTAAMHAHATAHAATVHAHAMAAHLLAALVASWWLRRGEAALWSLLRRAVALVPGLVAWWRGAPLPLPAGRAPSVPVGPAPPRRTALRHAVSRRGPPAPIPYPV